MEGKAEEERALMGKNSTAGRFFTQLPRLSIESAYGCPKRIDLGREEMIGRERAFYGS